MLEIGAGESTKLFDALSKHGIVQSVTTIEGDPDWQARIQSQVGHNVQHHPLIDGVIDGKRVRTFDLSALGDQRFDLILIDGPVGTRRWSRLQAVDALRRLLAPEGVLILDDALRPGELQTAGRLIELGHNRAPAMTWRFAPGAKGFFVMASPNYRETLTY